MGRNRMRLEARTRLVWWRPAGGVVLLMLALVVAGGGAPVATGGAESETRKAPDGGWNRVQADPANYREVVSELEPGDWLQLAPGDYPRALRLHDVQGTAERPIVISGPESGEPAVFHGRRGENTVSLLDAAHVVIRHLTLDGGGEPVSGVVAEAHGEYAHDITLESLTVRRYDRSQGNSAITTRVPAWNWVIRDSTIKDAGTGMYLGQPDGDNAFVGGKIENNRIVRTLGYNIQIKHQNSRDDVPGMPAEPRETLIRYNLLSKAERGSSGGRARPNLLVGHFPPSGAGAEDRYRIVGNLFYQNPHERLFQGEGNVALTNNLFVNHHGDALLVRPHNHVPRDVKILNNTIVAEGFGIRVDEPDPAHVQVVSGNAVFAVAPLQLSGGIDSRDNLTAERDEARHALRAPDAALDALDLYPRPGRMYEREVAVTDQVNPDWPELTSDYNARPRLRPVWGAYAGPPEANPGRVPGIGPAAPECAPCR